MMKNGNSMKDKKLSRGFVFYIGFCLGMLFIGIIINEIIPALF